MSTAPNIPVAPPARLLDESELLLVSEALDPLGPPAFVELC